ncbi:hypothetical protein HS961_19250 [Comamonas piscis]|uniref:DUF4198 domain-containing protein n=1 Tax=Comamonas piscis TaxID=1562974 RepID=A0A7G5ELC6_9BURK|nr:hypothetical protein [Comamonas piscis]QMV74801.1 hypothetical protein HS961_19250 [Comamonas piscis]WSO33272.1 hypothetical protein VUJ63_19310 [Comamonas piscis]
MSNNTQPSNLFRPLLAAAFAVSASIGAALPAHADYLWLQTENGQTRAQVGELHKAPGQLSELSEPRQVVAEGKTVPASADAYVLGKEEGAAADQRFSATRAGSDGVLTYYQARFGRQETKAVNDLELVPTTPQGNTYQLMFKGRPVAASQVNVDTSEGWRRVLAPAKNGTVSFTPSFPGLYVLEVTARVNNGSVKIDGKQYDEVRHTATLSFEVPQ